MKRNISVRTRENSLGLLIVPFSLRFGLVLLLLPALGLGDIQTTTQSLSPNISPAGKLFVPGGVTLTSSNTHFGAFHGSLLLSYWARTSDGGAGSVVVQANSEFVPTGGPMANSVTYLCSGATFGTACSGTQTIQTTSQTSIVALPSGMCTGGGGACSGSDPNTVELDFQMPNQPHYKTGSYSVQLTFTISTL